MGMNFRTAEDMNAILAVKLTKRLVFGMWTKMHLTGMHFEGKVSLLGVKTYESHNVKESIHSHNHLFISLTCLFVYSVHIPKRKSNTVIAFHSSYFL